MKRNRFDPAAIRVEDQRPSLQDKLLRMLETMSLGQIEDPVMNEELQYQLDENDYYHDFFDMTKRMAEGERKRQAAGPRPRINVGPAFNPDDYLTKKK